MFAPATAPLTDPPQSRLTPPRLLGAVVFAAIGFVAVWQGFGLAGFGTDAHALRVLVAVAPLFVCGLVLVWPRWSPLRAVVGLIGLVGAAIAWWIVPISPEPKMPSSLRNAAETRDWYKANLAIATVEELSRSKGHPELKLLRTQYPSLTNDLQADYDKWARETADEIISRYRRTPLDDFKGVEALGEPTKLLREAHPASADRLEAARRQWLSNALHAKTHELEKLKPGDWAGFNDTAFGRRTLVEALPDTRATILRAEREWVDSSVDSIVANNLAPKAGEGPTRREFWKQIHWEILALKSLDAEDNRFSQARGWLFKVAHDTAVSEAVAHFGAGDYHLAFGVARTHSVAWSATAAILGPSEEKSLTEFRGTYEFFDLLASKSAKPVEPPETAPPPRTKP